jgi:hypothetical protein
LRGWAFLFDDRCVSTPLIKSVDAIHVQTHEFYPGE